MPGSPQSARARRAIVMTALVAVLASPALAATAPERTGVTSSATPVSVQGSGRTTTSATSQIPCAKPSTTGAVSTKNAAADQAAANGTSWTGVLERVLAKLDSKGSVKGTPTQHTRVSASGESPVTVRVPVSGAISNSRKAGKDTQIVNHQAQVHLSPDGSAQQLVKTDFNRPLPVDVDVKYTLDGKSSTAGQVTGQSGTVKVSYTLHNVSTQQVNACFEGFDGQQQHITLKTPLPIYAWLSFTVPSEAKTFSAPGSSLSPDNKGVDVGWFVPLFQPLGPAKRTFTLTMKTSQATIPTATLWLDTVSPFTLTGGAPAASAQALGAAAAAVATGTSAVQNTLDSLQQAADSLQKSTSSSAGTSASGHGSGTGSDRNPSVVLDRLLTSLGRQLTALKVSLHEQAATAATGSTAARDLAALATDINGLATDIDAEVGAILDQLSPLVQDASLQVEQLQQLSDDLDALPAVVKGTPAFLKLVADLGAAHDTAVTVSNAVSDVHEREQAVADQVQTLQGDVTALAARATALQSATATLATQADRLAHERMDVIHRRFTAFDRHLARFQRRFATLEDHLSAVATSVKARLAQARATARQDLANALLHGEQDLQKSADQADAQLTQTEAATQNVVDQANAQYARLLALDELAVLYQLPGGTAPNVSEQSGIYYLKIAGTAGHTQRRESRQDKRQRRQTNRQDRRRQRRDDRHSRRQQRQDKRQERREQRQSNR